MDLIPLGNFYWKTNEYELSTFPVNFLKFKDVEMEIVDSSIFLNGLMSQNLCVLDISCKKLSKLFKPRLLIKQYHDW
jgi:hypothetical protein